MPESITDTSGMQRHSTESYIIIVSYFVTIGYHVTSGYFLYINVWYSLKIA